MKKVKYDYVKQPLEVFNVYYKNENNVLRIYNQVAHTKLELFQKMKRDGITNILKIVKE